MTPWFRRRLYERLFPRFRPRPEWQPRVASGSEGGAGLRIRWLGTAGHVLETATTCVLIDPFVSRPSLLGLASPLHSDETAIARHIPRKVDAVICGHSHFDHLLDAPLIARSRDASLIGSDTTCAFGRQAGISEDRMVRIPPAGGSVQIGDIEIRLVPSRHGRIVLHRVPFPGVMLTPPAQPRLWHYRMGGAFGVLLRAAGTTVYHNGSADLVDAELEGASADLLLVGLAGRGATPNYLERLVTRLRPRVIVPTHHDAFFHPLDQGVRLLPRIDLEGFAAEVHARAPKARLIVPSYHEALHLSAGSIADAALSIY